MLEPTLFAVPSQHSALFVVRPRDDGYWDLHVRVGANPLQDEDPDRYDGLTAGEVLDVLAAVAALHVGL